MKVLVQIFVSIGQSTFHRSSELVEDLCSTTFEVLKLVHSFQMKFSPVHLLPLQGKSDLHFTLFFPHSSSRQLHSCFNSVVDATLLKV